MKLTFIALACALALLSANLIAQTTDWKGKGSSNAAEKVSMLGTKPLITGKQSFRVVFRLAPLTNTEIPYAVLRQSGDLHGWEAVTSKLGRCTVSDRSGISNAPQIPGTDANSRNLVEYDGAKASMGKNRPTYVVANFKCDGYVDEGDEVTIQTEFFFRMDREWRKANYLFDKRVLQK